MITVARVSKKPTSLSQILNRRIRRPAPPAVVSWIEDHLRVPESDMKRMKKLYEKVMNDSISKAEEVELDRLMEVSAAMDVLRARILLGRSDVNVRKASRE